MSDVHVHEDGTSHAHSEGETPIPSIITINFTDTRESESYSNQEYLIFPDAGGFFISKVQGELWRKFIPIHRIHSAVEKGI